MRNILIVAGILSATGLGYVMQYVPGTVDNVQKWWHSPPGYLTEISLMVDKELDESTWTIPEKKEKEYGDKGKITNGKIVIVGEESDSSYYGFTITIKDKNVSSVLSKSELEYLSKKARKIYKDLLYQRALDSLQD